MDMLLQIASWTCLLLGSLFALVGGIGLLRLPDFFCRIHGGGITDTMGAGLILLGLMLQAPPSLVTIKLIMILCLLLVTSPTSTHALANAALSHGIEPRSAEKGDGSSTP